MAADPLNYTPMISPGSGRSPRSFLWNSDHGVWLGKAGVHLGSGTQWLRETSSPLQASMWHMSQEEPVPPGKKETQSHRSAPLLWRTKFKWYSLSYFQIWPYRGVNRGGSLTATPWQCDQQGNLHPTTNFPKGYRQFLHLQCKLTFFSDLSGDRAVGQNLVSLPNICRKSALPMFLQCESISPSDLSWDWASETH